MKKRTLIFCTAGILLAVFACEVPEDNTDLITFEEFSRDSSFYWNGSDGSGSFKSGNATFSNTYTVWEGGFTSWSGFAYSNHADVTTPGFDNQFSCYAGSGAGDSETFALIADGDTLTFTHPELVDKIALANTTYAALSMRDGDGFAKKFGGADGTDPDFFHLIITGINNNGEVTGKVTFVLADYTSDNPGSDFITDVWTDIPLDALGHVKRLAFGFDSSDKGDWGINTPKYACLDNIQGII